MAEYLMHYGTKGMKWGVRRFQNPDGTLTDEGRRHYGYGSGSKGLFTKNTKQHIKRGAKIGGLLKGGVAGVASGLMGYGTAASFATLGVSVIGGPVGAAAMSAGAAFVVNGVTGALQGAGIGAIVGAIATSRGRRYIESNDAGLSEFIERERSAS